MTESRQAIRIKLCGMTRPEDAALASELGADAIGVIFYEKSARNVSIPLAQEIVAAVNPLCSSVAVVVNPGARDMEAILQTVPINLIQFHGEETPEFCTQFQRPFIKAIRMREGTDLHALRQQYAGARALLLDTFNKNLVGGTGHPFDWAMLDADLHETPGPAIVLAGGLSPDNIARAIVDTGIRNLDVNSGIESAAGIKDPEKMRAVMRFKHSLTT